MAAGLPNVCRRIRPHCGHVSTQTLSTVGRRGDGMGRPGARRGGGRAVHDVDPRRVAAGRRAAGRHRGGDRGAGDGAGHARPAGADAAHAHRDVRRASCRAGRSRSTCRCSAAAARCRSSPPPCATRAPRPGSPPIAAFGASRRGFEFTELVMPDVAGRRRAPRLPRPAPRGHRLRVRRRPVPVLGARSSSAGRPSGARRGSRSWTVRPRRPYWYRLDHPPLGADGALDVGRRHRDVRHDARLRRPEARPRRRQTGSRRASTSRSTRSGRPAPAGCLAPARPPRRRRLRQRRLRRPAGTPRCARAAHGLVAVASTTQVMLLRTFAVGSPQSAAPTRRHDAACGRSSPHLSRRGSGGARGSRSRRRGRRRTSC